MEPYLRKARNRERAGRHEQIDRGCTEKSADGGACKAQYHGLGERELQEATGGSP